MSLIHVSPASHVDEWCIPDHLEALFLNYFGQPPVHPASYLTVAHISAFTLMDEKEVIQHLIDSTEIHAVKFLDTVFVHPTMFAMKIVKGQYLRAAIAQASKVGAVH